MGCCSLGEEGIQAGWVFPILKDNLHLLENAHCGGWTLPFQECRTFHSRVYSAVAGTLQGPENCKTIQCLFTARFLRFLSKNVKRRTFRCIHWRRDSFPSSWLVPGFISMETAAEVREEARLCTKTLQHFLAGNCSLVFPFPKELSKSVPQPLLSNQANKAVGLEMVRVKNGLLSASLSFSISGFGAVWLRVLGCC